MHGIVSVVIPVYNSARLVGQAVGSCMEQTYGAVQVLLIDDCSTDNSADVCRSLCRKWPEQVSLICKESNEGRGHARHTGLQAVDSEYLMFLDADDWLATRSIIEHMVSATEETGADYVGCWARTVWDSKGRVGRDNKGSLTGLVERPALFDQYYLSFFGKPLLNVSACAKLYRTDTLKRADTKPVPMAMDECIAFHLQLHPHLSSIYLLPEVGMCCRWGGSTCRFIPTLLEDEKYLFRLRTQMIERWNYPKAWDYIRIDLKRALVWHICQIIEWEQMSREQLIDWLSAELKQPEWTDILDFRIHKESLTLTTMQAIAHRDAEALYNFCLTKASPHTRRAQLTRTFKQFLRNNG